MPSSAISHSEYCATVLVKASRPDCRWIGLGAAHANVNDAFFRIRPRDQIRQLALAAGNGEKNSVNKNPFALRCTQNPELS